MANRTTRLEFLLSIRNTSVQGVIAFLRSLGLLKRTENCSACGFEMVEKPRQNHID